MQAARIKRTDPERVYYTMRNNDATDLVDGDLVTHITGASADGVSVAGSAATLDLATVCGIVGAAGIKAGEYGFVQVSGYHPNAKTTAATAGTGLTSSGTAKTATDAGGTEAAAAVIGIALTATASGRSKVWLRLM